jgi:hypothetical protein
MAKMAVRTLERSLRHASILAQHTDKTGPSRLPLARGFFDPHPHVVAEAAARDLRRRARNEEQCAPCRAHRPKVARTDPNSSADCVAAHVKSCPWRVYYLPSRRSSLLYIRRKHPIALFDLLEPDRPADPNRAHYADPRAKDGSARGDDSVDVPPERGGCPGVLQTQ